MDSKDIVKKLLILKYLKNYEQKHKRSCERTHLKIRMSNVLSLHIIVLNNIQILSPN